MFRKILLIIFIVLFIHLSIIYFRPTHELERRNISSSRMKLVIIDTDAGSDDAVAIFLALAVQEEVQVIAITCTYGNTDLANVEINVLKILTVANRPDIPVYGGAKKPFIKKYEPGDYFGKDGLGDFELDREIRGSIDRSKHATIAMIELAKKYAGDLSIIALGPLTNVALAASLDPNFTQNVKRFYVMGSRLQKPEEEPQIEFNFGLDPESNAIFLNSFTKVKSLIGPMDVIEKNNISKEWRKETFGKSKTDIVKFLNKAEDAVTERVGVWLPADSVAVAMMIWPDIITESIEARMSSVTCGPFNGSVIVETDSSSNLTKNVEIVRDFNVTAFKEKLLQYLA